jgi:hypothetical protein
MDEHQKDQQMVVEGWLSLLAVAPRPVKLDFQSSLLCALQVCQ